MDISLYISVLALIISIGVPFFEYIYNKSFNNINIEVSYYDEIYKDYLINKIHIYLSFPPRCPETPMFPAFWKPLLSSFPLLFPSPEKIRENFFILLQQLYQAASQRIS